MTNGKILNKQQFNDMTNHINNKAHYDGGFHSYKYNGSITRIHAGYFSGSHQYNKVELNQNNSEGIIVFFNELPENNNANILINNIINNYYQGELKPLMFETNKNNKIVNIVDKLDKNNKKEIIKNR